MNPQQRRAQQRTARAARSRADALAIAADYLAGSTDPTITGATVILPSGETMYLDRQTFRTAQGRAGGSGPLQ